MIHTEELTRTFKLKGGQTLTAVDALSIDVHKGEVFGFLGPNGAGKTTTIRMLSCLIEPTAGRATINGYSVGEDNAQIRRGVGILTETPGMYDRLSAAYNLTFFAKLYGVEDVEGQVEKYLRMLGLWSRRHDEVGSFSKGMRQKLALARALLHEPDLVFLDEPTSGLDPEAAHLVRDFISEMSDQGRTIFLCTHNLDEADRLCDRIAVFKTKLLVLDTPANLRRRLFGRQIVFHLREAQPDLAQQVEAQIYVNSAEVIDNKLVVRLDDPDRYNPDLIRLLVAAGADIQFVGELRYSLEDVYLQFIREDEKLAEENH
ncbi:MAG: ABC transporter ATP-binding protein [Chloroflexi bacterium]|nr:ABC transporter ATP-binding protein [Chloroflexota bacterium]